MLPVLNRPIIDYVVEDCIRAGITDIYFVVGKGATQIRDYYQRRPVLEDYLRVNGKDSMVDLITPPANVNFHFVEQDTDANSRFGTAIPVWLCRDVVGPDEHVLVLMGDDFIYNVDGSSEAARLMEAVQDDPQGSAMLGVQVPMEEVSRYGVIAAHEVNGREVFDHIQEKPSVEEAKSNLINVSKYILSANFFEYLDRSVSREIAETAAGEYYITDPLNDYVADGNVLQVLPARGAYLDGGTVEHWLEANEFVFRHQKQDS